MKVFPKHLILLLATLLLSSCCQAFVTTHKPLAVSYRSPATSNTQLQLSLPPQAVDIAQSLFRYSGQVPLWQAAAVNAFGFSVLSKKLLKSMTLEGLAHSFALGTLLWTTLGWRGWTFCVLYLVCGNIVTKVRFAEKEAAGLAEKRGGRRGPENVWCVRGIWLCWFVSSVSSCLTLFDFRAILVLE